MAGIDYSVADYYELQDILSFFPKKYFKVIKLSLEPADYKKLDNLFRVEVERTYQSKINNLPVPAELKNKLLDKIENYITSYIKERSRRNVDFFYIQNWKILIQKLF